MKVRCIGESTRYIGESTRYIGESFKDFFLN